MDSKRTFLKRLEDLPPGYPEKLHDYLLEHCDAYFNDPDNKACAWNDFDYFNKTTDRLHLVMPDEVMLIDRDWDGDHSYVICKVSESKIRQRCKNLTKVIEIREIDGRHWRNGYFLLPAL